MCAGQRGDGLRLGHQAGSVWALAVQARLALTRGCMRAGGRAGPRAGRRDDGRGHQAGGARPGRRAAGARAHGAQARAMPARHTCSHIFATCIVYRT